MCVQSELPRPPAGGGGGGNQPLNIFSSAVFGVLKPTNAEMSVLLSHSGIHLHLHLHLKAFTQSEFMFF